MSKVTLDPALQARLNGLDQELELCDESGETIGHFLREAVYRALLYKVAEAQCPYTPEQLAAARMETGGRTLKEWRRIMGVP
jgi:hypothetical protein